MEQDQAQKINMKKGRLERIRTILEKRGMLEESQTLIKEGQIIWTQVLIILNIMNVNNKKHGISLFKDIKVVRYIYNKRRESYD